MQELHAILQGLDKPQVKIFRSYLCYMSVRKDESNKQLELAQLLLRSKKSCPTDEECSRQIYGEKEDYKIHQLKRRLRAKVLDVLTMDINLNRKSDMDEVDSVSARLKKRLLQFQLLYRTKGNLDYNKRLLDDIIAEAQKYELYEVLIPALTYRKYFRGFCKGMKHFKEINKQIAFYEYAWEVSKKANDLYYQLTMWNTFVIHPNPKQKQAFIQKCILELKRYYKHSKSAIVLYYLKLVEMAWFEHEREYLTAQETVKELLELLKAHPSIYRGQRIGFAYDNIGYFKMYVGEFASAAEDFHEAQKYYPFASANVPVSKDLEFNAWLMAGELEKAGAVAKDLQKSSRLSLGDFRLAKYRFYKAAVKFRKKDFRGALKTLNMKFEISKDKTGWDLGIRLLMIMSNIELERFDEANTAIQSLRRLLDRADQEGTEIGERDRFIVKCLVILASNGFSAYGLPPGITQLWSQLCATEGKLAWKPFTPELVVFHHWLSERYKMKPIGKSPVRSLERRRTKRIKA